MRKQAIRWRKQGLSYVAIAARLEVRRNTVSNGWQAYQAEGVRGIQSQTRGRQPGEQRTLSPRQEQQSQALICDQTPEQYKLGLRSRPACCRQARLYPLGGLFQTCLLQAGAALPPASMQAYLPVGVSFALWTRQAVQALIRLCLKRTMPLRTVGETLKRWGFTPQKPLPAAGRTETGLPACCRQVSNDPHRSKDGWMRPTRPSSLGRSGSRLRYSGVMKRACAAIASMDGAMPRRAGRRSFACLPGVFRPACCLPEQTGRQVNMVSTVSNQGKVRFMVYRGRLPAAGRYEREAAASVFAAAHQDLRAQDFFDIG